MLLYLMKFDSSSQCFQINEANESQTLTSISEEHQINLSSNSLEKIDWFFFFNGWIKWCYEKYQICFNWHQICITFFSSCQWCCFLQNQNKSLKIKKSIVFDENLEKEGMFEKRIDITDVYNWMKIIQKIINISLSWVSFKKWKSFRKNNQIIIIKNLYVT